VVVVPRRADQRTLMDAIYLVKREGASSDAALRATHRAIADLLAAGVDSVLLACTELSALRDPALSGEVHDAADIVARHVVTRAMAATESPS
jgi:aspartate/glutamate racemase